jgi:hypothetical protein
MSSTCWQDAFRRGHRDAELHRLGVEGIHLLVVDGHLGEGAGREHPDGPHAEGLVLLDQLADPDHPFVGVEGGRGDEPVRVALQRLGTDAGGIAHADQAALDAPHVHLPQRHPDGIVGALQRLARAVLEHVLHGEVELLLGLGVLRLPGDEPVDLFHVGMREPHHGVDHPYVRRHWHR